MAMIKLINTDKKPVLPSTPQTIQELEKLNADNPEIWTVLLQYVEQLDAFAPDTPPTTEHDKLDLVRRLMVLCLSTEAVRITIQTDTEQLKVVEKESAEEVKAIQTKLKETEQKLAALKKVDKQVYTERLANAQRAAGNKVYKVQQQLFQKLHKFNMRSVPIAKDERGNTFWSLQYKSPTQPGWGDSILCYINYRFDLEHEWYEELKQKVDYVLTERDRMITEKNEERKKKKASTGKNAGGADGTESPQPSADGQDASEEPNSKPAKRKYPKLKIDKPKFTCKPGYYLISGKDEIMDLANWLDQHSDIKLESKADLESVSNYLSI